MRRKPLSLPQMEFEIVSFFFLAVSYIFLFHLTLLCLSQICTVNEALTLRVAVADNYCSEGSRKCLKLVSPYHRKSDLRVHLVFPLTLHN